MLIDDVKGALAALKTEMQEDRRIKSGADRNVGDIVYQNMDSRLDCAQLFPMKAKKSVAVRAERVGHLTAEDEAKVLPLVASCGFIDAHMRKVYRIGQK